MSIHKKNTKKWLFKLFSCIHLRCKLNLFVEWKVSFRERCSSHPAS